jgi:hypothetical protein
VAIVTAVMLFGVRVADAKPPLVVVKAEFGKGATILRQRMADDLTGTGKTPEQLVAEAFIAAMTPLKMFEFRPASQTQSQNIIVIKIDESIPGLPWPAGDVQMVLAIKDETLPPSPFCLRACDDDPSICYCKDDCEPPSFADAGWYQRKFDGVRQSWPTGFLKNIPLTSGAHYAGGHITVAAPIADFGQRDGGPPTAFFELINGNVHRQFVFCRVHDSLAEGDDHAENAQKNCSYRPPGVPLAPFSGTVYLLNGGRL